MTREEAIKILEYPVLKWSMEWDEREDGLSYYEAIDMAISALRQQDVADKDVGKNEPLTNAQKIRAMSDEELAAIIMCPIQFDEKADCVDGNCFQCSLKWLQQPAEEDKHENMD